MYVKTCNVCPINRIRLEKTLYSSGSSQETFKAYCRRPVINGETFILFYFVKFYCSTCLLQENNKIKRSQYKSERDRDGQREKREGWRQNLLKAVQHP